MRAPTILIVGNLLAGKGHELVLRAFARLKQSHPDLQCKIIGEGADRDRFARLAQDLGHQWSSSFSRAQKPDRSRRRHAELYGLRLAQPL